ncbi:hypothetical protein GCM10009430_44530 [Aquimarina litoralis]|uniref:Uncharacterized protein n=1 Tax=Aquimarina litoralis TaxID=584605 RepID=A0ABP3UEJ1_9FLAO
MNPIASKNLFLYSSRKLSNVVIAYGMQAKNRFQMRNRKKIESNFETLINNKLRLKITAILYPFMNGNCFCKYFMLERFLEMDY